MKLQSYILWTALYLGTVFSLSLNVDYIYRYQFPYRMNFKTKNIEYSFICLEDNYGMCKFLENKLYEAVNSISKAIDIEKPIKFEAFVDDLSKHRNDTESEIRAVLFNNELKTIEIKDPMNTVNTIMSINVKSPYPNAEAIIKQLKNTDNDFVLILNNFKSDVEYINTIRNDYVSLLIVDIFDGIKSLSIVGYPYSDYYNPDSSEITPGVCLPKRSEPEKINATAEIYLNQCIDLVNNNRIHSGIHWEDTLISKEKINTKGEEKSEKNKFSYNPKFGVNKNFNRIVAVGDIHGDYEHLIKILRHAKLIDKRNNWIGRDSILIQMGDLADRGNNTKKVFDTLIDLREQAQKKGGIVYMIYGNHDILQVQGVHCYTSKADIDNFGGIEALELAYGPDGKYGKFIRNEMNFTMFIDDTIYVHAGLLPKYAIEGHEGMNKRTREILVNTPSIDELNKLYLQNITHPIYTEPLLNFAERGPLWSRGFVDNPESVMCPELEKSLNYLNAKRIIMGHAVQAYGKITSKCQNKLIMIDVGISRCIPNGNYYGYLEILKNKKEVQTWARYLKKN